MNTLQINKDYSIVKESTHSMVKAGRFNPALELIVGEEKMTLGCGYGDDITVFKNGNEIFVLSVHLPLGYANIAMYENEELLGELSFVSGYEADYPQDASDDPEKFINDHYENIYW